MTRLFILEPGACYEFKNKIQQLYLWVGPIKAHAVFQILLPFLDSTRLRFVTLSGEMEEYPEELRTPPVSLVALFGNPEQHASITKHLHSQQPPINALAFPDFSHLSLLLAHDDKINRTSSFRDPLSVSDSSSPNPSRCGGILKRDWLLKHRTKVPALVAAFFPSHDVFGDPTQWLQVCSDLDSLKYFLISLICFLVAPPLFLNLRLTMPSPLPDP